MTALSVTQFKLVHDSVNRNAAEEHITTRFASTRNCLGRFCSFQTLMQLHEKQNPHLAYMAIIVNFMYFSFFFSCRKVIKFNALNLFILFR